MRVRTYAPAVAGFCTALAFVTALFSCAGPKDPGERVWARRCSACHGRDGRGRTRFSRNRPYADLTDGRWKQGGDRASIRRSISGGVPKSPMEGFGGRLSPAEIDAVTGYVLRLAAAPRPTPHR